MPARPLFPGNSLNRHPLNQAALARMRREGIDPYQHEMHLRTLMRASLLDREGEFSPVDLPWWLEIEGMSDREILSVLQGNLGGMKPRTPQDVAEEDPRSMAETLASYLGAL